MLYSPIATFAQKVEENDIHFIGPNKKTMEMMGDKITARQRISYVFC
jgi:acetyl-CoA carboxylase biotin carboxylase subunit